MVDDRDTDSRSVAGRDRQNASAGWSREEWESLDSDPDLGCDFEYELAEWEQFATLDGTDQVMFLPNEESELKDAAFVVADDSVVLDLAHHC